MCNNPPYQGIAEASQTTGLAQSYLRAGCRAGTVPHIRSGGKYYICVPALLEQLGAEARTNGGCGTGESSTDCIVSLSKPEQDHIGHIDRRVDEGNLKRSSVEGTSNRHLHRFFVIHTMICNLRLSLRYLRQHFAIQSKSL